ncbi:hypothetical protein F4804DRAFT_339360 [Jackrogersella minutella]|nr:hypothetical protein F4804DRAFT_339360 [Jackrogersella minutella]
MKPENALGKNRSFALAEVDYRAVEDSAKRQDGDTLPDDLSVPSPEVDCLEQQDALKRIVESLSPINDAAIQNEELWNMNFESDGFNIFGNSVAQSPVDMTELDDAGNDDVAVKSPLSSNPCLSERNPILEQDQALERQSWQSEAPMTILAHEHGGWLRANPLRPPYLSSS